MIETFLDVLKNKQILFKALLRHVDSKLFCIGTEIGCLYSYGFKKGLFSTGALATAIFGHFIAVMRVLHAGVSTRIEIFLLTLSTRGRNIKILNRPFEFLAASDRTTVR